MIVLIDNMGGIKMEITKQEFERYEEVREGGTTNMLLVNNVMTLSGLDKEKILHIMKNYEELRKKFS